MPGRPPPLFGMPMTAGNGIVAQRFFLPFIDRPFLAGGRACGNHPNTGATQRKADHRRDKRNELQNLGTRLPVRLLLRP